jgi:hypothetical protein
VRSPTHGWTKLGHAVHARVADHHPASTRYERFNRTIALWLTRNVGTMTCFWLFWLLCFSILPSVLHAMGVAHLGLIPSFMLSFGFNLAGTWLFSTCFQLTLLPALMVGQNLQNEASDARAAKTFEDTEVVVHGQEQAAARLAAHGELLTRIAEHLGVLDAPSGSGS